MLNMLKDIVYFLSNFTKKKQVDFTEGLFSCNLTQQCCHASAEQCHWLYDYKCTPLPDKPSAEDRSLLLVIRERHQNLW